jgi:glycosyltransferase involved in cell wall biosynthesis
MQTQPKLDSEAPTKPMVSAIMTFHGEKVLAHFALLGLERLRVAADEGGIATELIAVLDSADPETARIVKEHPSIRRQDQILEVRNADLASSRNDGIAHAIGSYIAILDGDDYYSRNWLVAALQKAQASDGDRIIHPELTISFGAFHCVARTFDMETEKYPLASCMMEHPWISCSFGRRDIYLRHPYQPTNVASTGLGYEDWHWNLETVADGIQHTTAPRTALFYRRKVSSMVVEMAQSGATIAPSRFFETPEKWQDGFERHGGGL